MITFICRRCNTASEIDYFRSRYVGICLACYRADTYVKNRGVKRRWVRLKHTAKKRGISLSLTETQYQALVKTVCVYCRGAIEETGAGIDRKDNTRGYEPDNVVPSCRWCNVVKNDHYTFEEMLELGRVVRSIRNRRQHHPAPPTHRENAKPRMAALD